MSYILSKLLISKYTQLLGETETIKEKNIQVYSTHPGWVKTDMGGEKALLEVKDGTVAFNHIIDKEWKIDDSQGKLFDRKKKEFDVLDESIKFLKHY